MTPSKPRPSVSLTVETLEDRTVPAVAFKLSGGGTVLRINGDRDHNVCTLSQKGSKIKVTVKSTPRVKGFFLTDPTQKVTKTFSNLDQISFIGKSGDDKLTNNTSELVFGFGDAGDDTLFGGSGRDHLYGGDDDDLLRGYEDADSYDGGAGFDKVLCVAGESVSNAEAVDILNLPDGSPQWANTCGPNSAWRVMQAYGGKVGLQQLVDRASESSTVSRWNLGTTGNTLVNAMNALRGSELSNRWFELKTNSTLDTLLAHVAEGKPVVAMINVSGSETYGSGIFTYTVPALHWVAVDGFDRAKGLVYYTETNGERMEMSLDSFNGAYNWNFGWASNGFLQGLGVVKGTFIV